MKTPCPKFPDKIQIRSWRHANRVAVQKLALLRHAYGMATGQDLT